jgi:hypothetical protein
MIALTSKGVNERGWVNMADGITCRVSVSGSHVRYDGSQLSGRLMDRF